MSHGKEVQAGEPQQADESTEESESKELTDEDLANVSAGSTADHREEQWKQ